MAAREMTSANIDLNELAIKKVPLMSDISKQRRMIDSNVLWTAGDVALAAVKDWDLESTLRIWTEMRVCNELFV